MTPTDTMPFRLRLVALLAVIAVPGMAGAAVCGNGILESGEACDDGNVVAGDCCSADCLVEDTACGLGVDHFKCYQARETPGTPRFAGATVSLADDFETVPVSRITRPRKICNNVSKDGEPIVDQSAHLACYATKDDRSTLGHFQPRNVQIMNERGTQQILVKKPEQLCVPSAKAIAPSLPGAIPNVDHYRCYKAKPAPGPALAPITVTLADEFERRLASMSSTFRFCSPVSKNGSPVTNPAAHLACYRIRDLGPKVNDLYGVVGSGSASNEGAVLVIDDATGAGLVLGTPVAGVGLGGVVFDTTGRLFATTDDGSGTFSDLIQVDPDTGALLADFGVIHDGPTNLRIADLAVQPSTNELFAVATPGGQLYTIDKVTAAATLKGDPGLLDTGGLAFAPDGTLYATTVTVPRLLTLDPLTGGITSNVAMDRAVDGLVVRSTGVIYGTEAGAGSQLVVTVATGGTTTAVGNTGAGHAADLSFRNTDPLPRVDVNISNQFGAQAWRARRKTADYLCLPTRILP